MGSALAFFFDLRFFLAEGGIHRLHDPAGRVAASGAGGKRQNAVACRRGEAGRNDRA